MLCGWGGNRRPSVGPGADPGVQAVSLQVTVSHPPGGRLPLPAARPAVVLYAAITLDQWWRGSATGRPLDLR